MEETEKKAGHICTGCGFGSFRRTHRSGTSTKYVCKLCELEVQVKRTGFKPHANDRKRA